MHASTAVYELLVKTSDTGIRFLDAISLYITTFRRFNDELC